MALEGIKPENGGLGGTWGCIKAFQCQGWRSEQSKAALTCGISGSGFPQVENWGRGYTGVTWQKPPLGVPPYSAS